MRRRWRRQATRSDHGGIVRAIALRRDEQVQRLLGAQVFERAPQTPVGGDPAGDHQTPQRRFMLPRHRQAVAGALGQDIGDRLLKRRRHVHGIGRRWVDFQRA